MCKLRPFLHPSFLREAREDMRAGVLQKAQTLQQREAAQFEQGQEALSEKAMIFECIINDLNKPFLQLNEHLLFFQFNKEGFGAGVAHDHSQHTI